MWIKGPFACATRPPACRPYDKAGFKLPFGNLRLDHLLSLTFDVRTVSPDSRQELATAADEERMTAFVKPDAAVLDAEFSLSEIVRAPVAATHQLLLFFRALRATKAATIARTPTNTQRPSGHGPPGSRSFHSGIISSLVPTSVAST